jgi:hypothetical protein
VRTGWIASVLWPISECGRDAAYGQAGGITIQNGTLEGFAYGIEATTTTPNKLTHLLVQNITFKNNIDPAYTSSEDIHLSHTNGVIISGANS